MKRVILWVPIIVSGACANSVVGNDDPMPFPTAEPGETRYVIRLPELADESAHRVEIEIGKVIDVDCNAHWFGGHLEQQVVAGWGYPMYRLTGIAGPAATRMACPAEEKRPAFVPVRLDDPLLRYNSKLPVVVYVPQGFEVRYRIWSAEGDALPADTS